MNKFTKITARLNKKIYPSCPNKKKLITLIELRENYTKGISQTWKILYNSFNYNPIQFQQNKVYRDNFLIVTSDQWDYLELAERKLNRISKSIDTLCAKYSLCEQQVNKEFYLLNKGRLSQSF